jgi:hypothetical protein
MKHSCNAYRSANLCTAAALICVGTRRRASYPILSIATCVTWTRDKIHCRSWDEIRKKFKETSAVATNYYYKFTGSTASGLMSFGIELGRVPSTPEFVQATLRSINARNPITLRLVFKQRCSYFIGSLIHIHGFLSQVWNSQCFFATGRWWEPFHDRLRFVEPCSGI